MTSTRAKDCIRQAPAAGIPTFLIEDELAVPRQAAHLPIVRQQLYRAGVRLATVLNEMWPEE